MHPYNPYVAAPPDFAALCQKDRRLAELCSKHDPTSSTSLSTSPYLDFQDANVLRFVTEATLEHDFGVHCPLRDDRLCPPIPNRINYIAWIRELLEACHCDAFAAWTGCGKEVEGDGQREAKRARREIDRDQEPRRRILDVGTGASCIYPILGCVLRPSWTFLATDIDAVSIEHARSIVEDLRNNQEASPLHQAKHASHLSLELRKRVRLLSRSQDQSLLLDDATLHDRGIKTLPGILPQQADLLYHASMCNPPFYASKAEMDTSLDRDAEPKCSVYRGTPGEMVYDGGEVAFVTRMIAESEAIATRALWFSSMLGKLSSVRPLVEELKRRSIDTFCISELAQGKTKRFALAWSFAPFRVPKPMVAVHPALQALQPIAGRHVVPLHNADNRSTSELIDTLADEFKRRSFFTSFHSTDSASALLIFVERDTWSRKARRRQLRAREAQGDSGLGIDAREASPALQRKSVILGVKLHEAQGATRLTTCALEALWIFGSDRQLFDSFVMSVLVPLTSVDGKKTKSGGVA